MFHPEDGKTPKRQTERTFCFLNVYINIYDVSGKTLICIQIFRARKDIKKRLTPYSQGASVVFLLFYTHWLI